MIKIDDELVMAAREAAANMNGGFLMGTNDIRYNLEAGLPIILARAREEYAKLLEECADNIVEEPLSLAFREMARVLREADWPLDLTKGVGRRFVWMNWRPRP